MNQKHTKIRPIYETNRIRKVNEETLSHAQDLFFSPQVNAVFLLLK